MHVQSDTIPVEERDRRNTRPVRWLVNQAGYRLSDVKAGKARVKGVAVSSWKLIDSKGVVRGSGTAAPSGSRITGYTRTVRYEPKTWENVFDSTAKICAGEVTEFVLPTNLAAADGPFRVVSDADSSAPFSVEDDLYGMLRDASLRFFGVQRSGTTSSWLRPLALADDPVPGGWYDCGGHVKDGITIGYAMEVLGALAAVHPDRDPDRTSWLQSLEKPDGVPDMVRELRHGSEYALAAWDQAEKNPANMITWIGDYIGKGSSWTDEMWLPLFPASHGGPGSRFVYKEMGGNIAGGWAAGLAFASRLYAKSDPEFAARAIEVARGLYSWGKANPAAKSSSTRNDFESSTELALAAVALLWATRDTTYLFDLTRNDSIAKSNWTTAWYASGGWLGKLLNEVHSEILPGPMAVSNPSPLAHYSFLRLILANPDSAFRYGVDPTRYENLRERAMYGGIRQLGAMSLHYGDLSIVLPGDTLRVDQQWKFPRVKWWGGPNSGEQSGIYGQMLLYANLARTFEDRPTRHFPVG
ncbi:MAG: glycoside hydrolase family 9 protein, partial [Fibrobacterota bacterium]